MLIIKLLKTEIDLKIGSSSQKLFDFNRLKIVLSMGVYLYRDFLYQVEGKVKIFYVIVWKLLALMLYN